MSGFDFEFTDDVLDINDIDFGRNQWAGVISEWEKTDNKTLVFKLKNMEQKKKCLSSLRSYVNKKKKDYTVYSSKSKTVVYLVRA